MQVNRRDIDWIGQRPKKLVRKPARRADAVLRVAAEELVVGIELVIDFCVPTGDVITALGRHDQVVGGAIRRRRAGVIRRLPRIPRQDVLRHRVVTILRNHVVRKRIANPVSVDEPRRAGIVNRIASSAEIEVAVIHVGAGYIADESFGDLLVMALEPAEKERLVLSVVEMRNPHRSAGGSSHFVVRKRIARDDRTREHRGLTAPQLFEVLAVDELAVQVAVFRAAVKLVGSALHDAGKLPAGAMSKLGREPGGVHLELLDHVERGGHDGVEAVGISEHRFLGVDAVDGVAERALPLADGMLFAAAGADHVHAGHIEIDPVEGFLQDRHFDEGLAFQDLPARRSLGFEQRRRAGDQDGLGDVADVQLYIQARLLGRAQGDAVLDIGLESVRLDPELVIARIEIRNVPGPLRRGEAVEHISGVFVRHRHLGMGDNSPC